MIPSSKVLTCEGASAASGRPRGPEGQRQSPSADRTVQEHPDTKLQGRRNYVHLTDKETGPKVPAQTQTHTQVKHQCI